MAEKSSAFSPEPDHGTDGFTRVGASFGDFQFQSKLELRAQELRPKELRLQEFHEPKWPKWFSESFCPRPCCCMTHGDCHAVLQAGIEKSDPPHRRCSIIHRMKYPFSFLLAAVCLEM